MQRGNTGKPRECKKFPRNTLRILKEKVLKKYPRNIWGILQEYSSYHPGYLETTLERSHAILEKYDTTVTFRMLVKEIFWRRTLHMSFFAKMACELWDYSLLRMNIASWISKDTQRIQRIPQGILWEHFKNTQWILKEYQGILKEYSKKYPMNTQEYSRFKGLTRTHEYQEPKYQVSSLTKVYQEL